MGTAAFPHQKPSHAIIGSESQRCMRRLDFRKAIPKLKSYQSRDPDERCVQASPQIGAGRDAVDSTG